VKKKRVIIAGQVPPPIHGQNILIGQILDELRSADDFETIHWPFSFSRDLNSLRRIRFGKVIELIRAFWRLLRIRLSGPIDLMLYPAGGPHLVPIIRDICLLPAARLLSGRLVIQFHAAGLAESMRRSTIFHRLLMSLMRRADSAIVMTNFNRIDPESVGIRKIDVIPIRITDEFRNDFVQRDALRILYVGHLCPDKGTPALLAGFAPVAHAFPQLTLELVGEPLLPYDASTLRDEINRLGIEKQVVVSGVLVASEKWRAFGRANIFIFPTVAPFESFGIVLAEAMMFSLPILATDWRGNKDVLGESPGLILFSPKDLPARIEETLRIVLARRNEWEGWERQSRLRYEQCFKQNPADRDYIELVRRLLAAT
jgi:glycosyltransferase involved in cell wall biosynthesis